MQQTPRPGKRTPFCLAVFVLLAAVFATELLGCGGQISAGSIGPQAGGGETPRAAATLTATPALLPLPGDIRVQSEDAWARARAILPSDVVLYKPTYVPPRFGPPVLLEARTDPQYGALYTIVYTAPEETLAFILNVGQGAPGNFPPPERREPITVLREPAELLVSTETHALGVFWQAGGGSRQIKAYSSVMTTDEMKKIVAGLIPQ